MNEEKIIELIKNGDTKQYELIIRKYNQRLYRIARAIIKEDSEVEDILQDTYLKAYQALSQFQNKSQFSTWITRILINNANARLKKKQRIESTDSLSWLEDRMVEDDLTTPDNRTSNLELKKILEESIDNLPESLRTVYVMREIEGLNVLETAQCLDISEENVKTRLHRAKAFLKEELYKRTKGDIELFRFGLERCDRVAMAVMIQIGNQN
jgi:RNA polymerase sigma-70 factor (ECF subfamily)